MGNQAFQAAADEIRRQIDEKVALIKADPVMNEVLKLHEVLNGLEKLMDQPRTSLGDLLGFATEEASRLPGPPSVRFDEFFGLAALEAAKKYLKKCTDARPFQEIVDAIRSGGGKVESEEDLRKGLSRSTLDMVKIGDRYGLREHYPHIKIGKKRKMELSVGEPAQPGDEAIAEEPER